MGAGASSLMRLRKTLVLRAYNTRKNDETLEEQFRRYTYKKDSISYISLGDVKTALSLDAPWVDDLFRRCIGETVEELEFQDFMLFMDTGKPPRTGRGAGSEPKMSHSRSVPGYGDPPEGRGSGLGGGRRERRAGLTAEQEREKVRRSNAGDLSSPRTPRTHPLSSQTSGSSGSPASSARDSDSTPPLRPETRVDNQRETETETEPVEREGEGEVEYSVIEAPSDDEEENGTTQNHSHSRSSYSGSYTDSTEGESCTVLVKNSEAGQGQVSTSNPKPLWRKREVVRQERTVHYTTLDGEGVVQELVEKETTQTEVLHMECRETGEFAHRETSSYEQSELFNNEVVAEEQGQEEYVHLKSTEDEFEYMNSTMPKKASPTEGEREKEGPPSPLREAGEQEGGEREREREGGSQRDP
eukprot:CAMPEP_0182439088 /NCGR_PEP_ID=MMETSP1167-20130531/86206_1 /TAXON_ID=2988 /ORGANISM="Mallomonas Sp, Strain CCMP3275" /LENGTH=413 /DNA_ID=CAMNT_0024632689 /DNA_START=93 /DNA_END=1334 /DNA_ORIENTATION=-